MVEFSIRPFRDGVALGAGCGGIREAGGNVIRNVAAERWSLVPVCQMAADAVRRVQCVVVADMAGRAGRIRGRHVRAG